MEDCDDVDVEIDLDEGAQQFFDTLSYSHRRAYVDWITSAKKSETRERRVGQAVVMLAEGRKR